LYVVNFTVLIIISVQHNLAKGRIAIFSLLEAANGFVRFCPMVAWTHTSQPPNGVLIGSAIFVQLTHMPKSQTDRPRYMWYLYTQHPMQVVWPTNKNVKVRVNIIIFHFLLVKNFW